LALNLGQTIKALLFEHKDRRRNGMKKEKKGQQNKNNKIKEIINERSKFINFHIYI
jgi:hypothetical protein